MRIVFDFQKRVGGYKKGCTFAARNFFTKYALGIFYTHKANVKNILVRASVFYFAIEQVKEFRRLGSFSPFLFIKQ
jgi:hypothetical protein